MAADGPPARLCDDGSVERVFGVAAVKVPLDRGEDYLFRPLPKAP